MRGTVRGFLPLLVIGLLAAGCGDGGGDGEPAGQSLTPPASEPAAADPGGSAGGPDPCGLLTEAEVSEAVGGEVTRTEPTEEHLAQACFWYFPDQEFPDEEGTTTVHIWDGEQFYLGETDLAALDYQSISDIGDRAHQWPPTIGICTVTFQAGEFVVQVTTAGASDADNACVGLARAAAGRV